MRNVRTSSAALLGAALLVCSCARSAEPIDPPSPPAPGEPAEFANIPKSHPRLLVVKEAHPQRLSVEEFRRLAPKELLKRPVKRPDPSVHALRYILTGKDEEAAAAVALLKVRGSMHYQKIDLWLPQYALAYDWICDWKGLGDEDRATIEENILAGGRGCLGLTTGKGRQVFHNSYAQMLGTLGLAGLALFDRPEGRKLLATAIRQYEKEWMAAWDYKGGAVHEGASYAPEFAKPMYQFLAAYASATGRDMFAENEKAGKGLSEFLHWMDWIERPDGTYSREGDIVTGWRSTTVAERAYLYDLGLVFLPLRYPEFMYARDRISKQHGLWAYREDNLAWAAAFKAQKKFQDEMRPPMLPAEVRPPPPPPLARLFGREAMGFVAMRSGRGAKDAHLTFHCGDHFGNHQHFDGNHFAIFAGGAELAIDNGYYSKYGGPHFKKYWKSSWAHNTICVRRDNPQEGWTGEQRHLEMKQCFSVADYKKNRLAKFETGDLLGFEAAPGGDWAWASGDAAKAYPADVLKKFVRQVVYLKDANALVVYDEVTPAREEDRPVFLVQCVKEPEVNERFAVVQNGGMVLYVQPVLPAAEALKLEAVHGPDVHGKKIWEGARKSTVEKLGAWRVEVSRKAGGKTRFLVVLTWGPLPDGRMIPGPAELVEKNGRVGVRLAGAKREVLFDADPSKPPEVRAAE